MIASRRGVVDTSRRIDAVRERTRTRGTKSFLLNEGAKARGGGEDRTGRTRSSGGRLMRAPCSPLSGPLSRWPFKGVLCPFRGLGWEGVRAGGERGKADGEFEADSDDDSSPLATRPEAQLHHLAQPAELAWRLTTLFPAAPRLVIRSPPPPQEPWKFAWPAGCASTGQRTGPGRG